METSKLAELVAIYQQQLASYTTMFTLAEEQRKCVEASNYPVLVEILERRDRIAAEIAASSAQVRLLCQEISQEMGLVEVNLSSLREKLSDQVLSPLADVLAEITAVIEKIQAADRESESQLKQVFGLLRGQISDQERGQLAAKAYQQATGGLSPKKQQKN